MKFYGLRSKQQDCLMGVYICSDGTVELTQYVEGDILWTTSKREIAEHIAGNPPSIWHNADWNTPTWSKSYFGTLEVVDLVDEMEDGHD